jgi:hypothetical protein
MGIKEGLEKLAHDTQDKLDEVRHRAGAEGERQQRDLNGDLMTPAEKVGSVLREGKHEVLAEVDAAKVDIRHAGD